MLVWLGQPADVATVGAKSAQLSHLFAQYPIPLGFCLPVTAFAQWVKADCPDNLPDTWQTLVLQAYQQLAVRTQTSKPPVAVRSSAIDEDSQTASFAGQYETYLNVSGVEALSTAILACWHSAFAERVQVYRKNAEQSLGVLVQWMVPADISMVVFSRHPVTQQPDVVINATWGLGQSLVDGSTTPDTYVVRRADSAVIEQVVGSKETMTIRQTNGVMQVATPRAMRSRLVLTKPQTKEVTQLSLRLEAEMGWPVDLEAAYHQDRLYLLQCRPITT